MSPCDEDEAFRILKEHKEEDRAKKKKGAKGGKTSSSSAAARMTQEERRDLIRSGLARKKECEHRAVEIVQRLAGAHEDSPQPRIDPDWLESCSRMLTPSHYSDAVHERAAAGLCGLPVCPVEGGGRVDPKEAFQDRGKFRIDSRNNRVYDVTERKKFCSDPCYRRSVHFSRQISTEPLWMRPEARDPASEKFRARLAPLDAEDLRAISGKGEEVQLSAISRADLEEAKRKGSREQGQKVTPPSTKSQHHQAGKSATTVSTAGRVKAEEKEKGKALKTPVEMVGVPLPVQVEEEENPPPPAPAPKRLGPTKRQPRKKRATEEERDPFQRVKHCLWEWVTLGTVRVLSEKEDQGSGLQDLRRKMLAAGCDSEAVEAVAPAVAKEDKSPEEEELSRRLDGLALEREEEDASALEKEDKNKDRRAQSIREEAEEDALKLGAFLGGKTVYEKEVEKKKDENGEEDDSPAPVLPLLDRHAQGALRRKVVMDQVQKVLPDILQLCGGEQPLLLSDVSSRLRRLVASFHLTADNVLMRPREWSLAVIALLVMLSRCDPRLSSALSSTGQSSRYLDMMLLSLGVQDMSVLSSHVEWLTEAEGQNLRRLAEKHKAAALNKM